MSNSHRLVRNNPYLPYCCPVPGRGYYYLQYPHTLRAAKVLLNSLSSPVPEVIMRQCQVCHRFITGANSPDVDHHACPPGRGNCDLPHHPQPCPFVDDRGAPCDHVPLSPTPPHTSASESRSEERTLLQQIETLRREKEEEATRSNRLLLANINLRENQEKLHQENNQLRLVSPSTSSFTPTTTTTTSSSSSSSLSRPSMGVGYSNSFGASIPSTAGGSIPGSIASAAQSLAGLNAPPQQAPRTISGYGGPTIPQLRTTLS